MTNRSLGIAALAALLVLDLLLVFFAIRPDSTAATSVAARPAATARPGAGAGASARPKPAVPNVSQQRSVSLLEGGSALMATPGSCGSGGAAVFRSTDSGATWTGSDSPGPIVPRVTLTGAEAGFAIAAGQGCEEALLFRDTNSLQGWSEGIRPADTWFVLPQVPARINGPAGLVDSPCGQQVTVGLTPSPSPEAAVLCADGFLQKTTDGGTTWVRGEQLAGGRAIGGDPAGELLALASVAGCDGLGVFVADPAGAWQQTTCLSGAERTGSVGITTAGTTVIAVDGAGKTFASTDSGRTFA
jgi:hypothetical protein